MEKHQEPTVKKDNTLLGIILGIAAVLTFASHDAITKELIQTYPAPFLVLLRFWTFALFAICLIYRTNKSIKSSFKTNKPILQILRGIIIVLEMALMAIAFRHMQLVDAHAIFAFSPLIVTALAMPILGEKVGWRRWLAVGAGFLGVLIILRPGIGVFEPVALIPFICAILFAVYIILTRLVSGYDTASTTLFFTAVAGALIASPVGLYYWSNPNLSDWGLIALLCGMGIVAHFLVIKSLEYAKASVLQPFNYLMLVWASFLGYLIFSEVPDLPTILGSLLVVGSGLFVVWRERVRGSA